MLRAVLPFTVRQFARAIVMPNLVPPVTTTDLALAYRVRILAALAPEARFTPLMTLYLTDTTCPDDLRRGFSDDILTAAKLYPANATTNSAAGVTDIRRLDPVLAAMADCGMPLLVHGEVTDPAVDVFDRESVFIERVLIPLTEAFPTLRIVFEHITTRDAVAFVRSQAEIGQIAATITAHHLIINRNALFLSGLRPHHYCLPVAKREAHRCALVEAATSGEPWFFLGTDSAPHPATAKESDCGCAGIFTAPTALELYAEVFEAQDALDKLEGFASLNGPLFYGLPPNRDHVTLEKSSLVVPLRVNLPESGRIVPFRAGQTLVWRQLPG